MYFSKNVGVGLLTLFPPNSVSVLFQSELVVVCCVSRAWDYSGFVVCILQTLWPVYVMSKNVVVEPITKYVLETLNEYVMCYGNLLLTLHTSWKIYDVGKAMALILIFYVVFIILGLVILFPWF